MSYNAEFSTQLQEALAAKREWYDSTFFPELLNNYRTLYACVKNLYDNLVKKSLVHQDPYRMDTRISDIIVPENSSFSDNELPTVLGDRLSQYETMLDFICTYYQFSLPSLPVGKIKKLMEFNACIDWIKLNAPEANPNTKALAKVVNQLKVNAPNVMLILVTDSCTKAGKAYEQIGKMLTELAQMQKEFYKGEVREKVIESPEFNKDTAFSSPESEHTEIKKLFPKLMGNTPFYNDLVCEIIKEDLAENCEDLRKKLFAKLAVQGEAKKEKKGPDQKDLLINALSALCAVSPTLEQLNQKLIENFDLLYYKKKTIFSKLGDAFRKAFGITEKERICSLPVTESKSGTTTVQKVNVAAFLADIDKKCRLYSAVSNKGAEYQKIVSTQEETVLSFLNKQISENQKLYIIINAFDDFFKKNVDAAVKNKVKGMKIELSAMHASILNANKRRGEYLSLKDENEQMKKLGIKNGA